MEILAFMRIPAKWNAYSGGNPRHSGNQRSFSHANCPEVRFTSTISIRGVFYVAWTHSPSPGGGPVIAVKKFYIDCGARWYSRKQSG
jgi:hypothetical protein